MIDHTEPPNFEISQEQALGIAPRSLGFALVIPALSLIATTVFAETSGKVVPSYSNSRCLAIEGQIHEAVRFVEGETGTSLGEVCIKIVSPETISEAFRSTGGITDQHQEIGGLFIIADETILIPTNLDLASAFDLSFLVHEVTHFYQFQSEILQPEEKLGHLECEAYLMQASYLRSQGLKHEALIFSLLAELQIGSVCEY